MKLKDILPVNGLPHSGLVENCEELWQGSDSREAYREHGGHPLYGEHDIIYRYNSHGFRGEEFAASGEVRMVAIGCSWTFGVGIPQTAIFHELFAERLRRELGATVANYNLGRPGASGDYVARQLHLVMPQLKPDLVLVLFPRMARREYVAAHDLVVQYTPNARSAEVYAEITEHFLALTSSYDDQLNFFRNYKSVEALLKNIRWIFSMTFPHELKPLAAHLNQDHQTGGHQRLDHARDHGHPGPNTHRLLYNVFWEKFVETGGLEQMRVKLNERRNGSSLLEMRA